MITVSNRSEAASLITRRRPYTNLYQAVILRAVRDLAQHQYRDEARQWLLSPESDFAFTTAGFSPDGIRGQVI
jgi:hypothetical protein